LKQQIPRRAFGRTLAMAAAGRFLPGDRTNMEKILAGLE
jgi:hypothetical protein